MNSAEVKTMAERVLSGSLSAKEVDRLNNALRNSEEARRVYLDYLSIHARLAWDFGPRGASARPAASRLAWIGTALAAIFLIGVLVFVLAPPSAPPPLIDREFPATYGRTEAIEVLPAPGGLKIDGDLADWPSTGGFRSAVAGEDGRSRWMEGRMSYDAANLYIGARVGDPFPLRNRTRSEELASKAWRGGALQVRLSTDRARPWPVQADHLEIRRREGRDRLASDVADSLVHLTLWRSEPDGQACLHLAYGMDFERDRANPAGFRGVVRPDGPGYALEYAIPWALLGAGGAPPRSGDVLAVSWTATWSDASGLAPLGQLVDVLSPDRSETRWTFMRASDWGKAIYR